MLLIGAKDDDGEMFWSFPKGHQEDGESNIETALRETFEEVGLNVEIVNRTPIIVSHHIHNGKDIKEIYLFPAKSKDEKIKAQAGEVELYQWLSFDEADNDLVDYYKEAWHKARKIMRL